MSAQKPSKRIVDWETYCHMTDREKLHVDVVSFTGYADSVRPPSSGSGTLGAGRAGEEEAGERSELDLRETD